MISPERLDLMQRQWVRLLDTYGIAAADAYPIFDDLIAAYSEPQRHYHTLEHLGELFRVIGRLPLTEPGPVFLAIWFHDVIYDPKAKNNEERSAAYANEQLASLGIGSAVRQRVSQLILATAHLTADVEPADSDTAALLDADLAILGASEVRYRRYAADVRREYAWVSDADYREGRTAVLRQFLARKRLYHTALMHEEGDIPARQNLQNEIAELNGESRPRLAESPIV